MIDPILVPVGDVRNAADPTTGYGRVTDSYRIGKYEVTIGEYATFLNAVASSGDDAELWNSAMGSDSTSAGISRSEGTAPYTYTVTGPAGITPTGATSPAQRPITYVNWYDAARFANWMANGQPTGGQTSATTENGAYDLVSATPGTVPSRNAVNPNTGAAPSFFMPSENQWYKAAYYAPTPRTTENGSYNLARSTGGRAVARNAVNPNTRAAPTFFIPTENEWYKAAYYTPDKGGVPGYNLYATQQDVAPTNNPASTGGPIVNYLQGVIYCVTQSAVFSPTQNYLTDASAFATSGSHYGTLNQNGTVYQWNDLAGARGLLRGLRGGFWAGGAITLRKETFTQVTATREANDAGFRLVAGPAVVTRRP